MEKGSKKKTALPSCLIHRIAPATGGSVFFNWAADANAVPEPPRLIRRVEFNERPVRVAPQPARMDEALRDAWAELVLDNPEVRQVIREELAQDQP